MAWLTRSRIMWAALTTLAAVPVLSLGPAGFPVGKALIWALGVGGVSLGLLALGETFFGPSPHYVPMRQHQFHWYQPQTWRYYHMNRGPARQPQPTVIVHPQQPTPQQAPVVGAQHVRTDFVPATGQNVHHTGTAFIPAGAAPHIAVGAPVQPSPTFVPAYQQARPQPSLPVPSPSAPVDGARHTHTDFRPADGTQPARHIASEFKPMAAPVIEKKRPAGVDPSNGVVQTKRQFIPATKAGEPPAVLKGSAFVPAQRAVGTTPQPPAGAVHTGTKFVPASGSSQPGAVHTKSEFIPKKKPH